MKVNHPGNNPIPSGEASGAKHSGRAAATHEAKQSEKASPAGVDRDIYSGAKTEISSKSKEFAQAKALASETPDVREDRVADLKRKIADGTYKIDGESIADRLVDDHLRMSGIG